MTVNIEVANAPVSYGAFERTVGIDPDVPAASDVLDAVARAGYRGIDLGPIGYLGDLATLREELSGRDLLLTGGYLEVDVSSREGVEAGKAELLEMLGLFDTLGPVGERLRARPTVAITAGEVGTVSPDGEAGILRLAIAALDEMVAISRARGYEPCLHNEIGTIVATAEDIASVLESSEVSLCLDTGHLVVAGGDPIGVLERWWPRVDHVHVKDVSAAGLEWMASPAAVASDVWAKGAFCALGEGVGRIPEVLDFLLSRSYSGWVVVEQDVLPEGAGAYRQAAEDQVHNRGFLRSCGF